MKIKLLSPLTISRIAAGEVIERPASAIKELIENSIDAQASEISIILNNAGRNLISITDNGFGMRPEDLLISADRHTTSKLDEVDIFDIKHFGFRGEALPSIASVSRLNITSRHNLEENAWSINVIGGEKSELYPASLTTGTRIEVRDLFFATPARLKFLKSEKTELQYIIDIVNKIALAHHNISFTLATENKITLKLQAQKGEDSEAKFKRIAEILGKNFAENSTEINETYNNIKIKGFTSIPTYNKSTSSDQYFFINNRPVRDKILQIAVKIAYQDFIANNRYPVTVLFLDLPTEEVDVNVHPTKAEVRFRDAANIRSIVIRAIKNALTVAGDRTSSTISEQAIININKNISLDKPNFFKPASNNVDYSKAFERKIDFVQPKFSANTSSTSQSSLFIDKKIEPIVRQFENEIVENTEIKEYPLGSARCQLHETYIISQTSDSIIIIDQHAAHERLVYEKLKISQKANNIPRQRLLIPEIVELDEKRTGKLIEIKKELENLGLYIEQFGINVIVNEIPHIIANSNIRLLINDLADELIEFEENISLHKLIEHILETFACHHSIRSGRKLNINEMNALLREMEATPYSGQCNHGRPTYIKLKLNDIEKLFGRS
ncbi:MAG: DNA mismatch repair endonuclease MutL [Alphaproteobacteria bacterium]